MLRTSFVCLMIGMALAFLYHGLPVNDQTLIRDAGTLFFVAALAVLGARDSR